MNMFEELEKLVTEWAKERGIIRPGNGPTQLLKAVSELGELCDAEIKSDVDGCIDGVGDVIVCLINYCAISGYNLTSCLRSAYSEIANRKGRTNEHGTFIKE